MAVSGNDFQKAPDQQQDISDVGIQRVESEREREWERKKTESLHFLMDLHACKSQCSQDM